MHTETSLLVIGAGPFGLALAACASRAGVRCAVAGRPMSFWTDHMPRGMFLRSGPDWHLDTAGVHTIDAFLAERGITAAAATPLPRDLYVEYVEWFRCGNRIEPIPVSVARLDRVSSGAARFLATCENGDTIAAASVALAVGFHYFRHSPPALTAMIPPARLAHTCDCVDASAMRGRRCLIVGGRQSAFEWAALLLEAGAAAVHMTYRHDTPRFAESDWSWVPAVVERFAADPGWHRRIGTAERDGYNRRLWEEGRLKLEPWLVPRLASPALTTWPGTEIARAVDRPDGLDVTLTSGATLAVDQVVLATGYKVDMSRIPFLASGNLAGEVATRHGSPLLDDRLQTSVPGLFATSFAATQEFGSFFGFTVSARTAALLVAGAVAGRALTR
ncbi:MAG TPA: NAD(P)-binding domain-containing protein [Vicinamibacterales bacterium]|nr:NAD(P)-binding domain-containing protein [Vicinamibacterales bacterium]